MYTISMLKYIAMATPKGEARVNYCLIEIEDE